MSTVDDTHAVHRGHHHDSAELTLRDYWLALWAQRWLLVIVAAAVVLVVLVDTLLMPTRYRATSTLQIEREALNVVNVENLMPAESP
ncbi:Wzz/FepE/Etk N-terminal domain-containing protein, partial [Paraburkholderia sp. SIMBA_054]|uniref:Wzz/FepE/Etk N-terminal domain-containing protein n=1 Tax=Paraburkholderia sp. SIMBA_054 TaxID=3085795 RepID=UPI00397DB386